MQKYDKKTINFAHIMKLMDINKYAIKAGQLCYHGSNKDNENHYDVNMLRRNF